MMLTETEATRILEKLCRTSDYADIYIENKAYLYLRYDDGRLDRVVKNEDRGFAVRSVCGDVTYFFSGNDLSRKSIKDAVDQMAQRSKLLPGKSFAAIRFRYFGDTGDERDSAGRLPEEGTLDEKVALLKTADKAIRGYDPGISQATIVYTETVSHVEIYNTEGIAAFEPRRRTALHCTAVAAGIDGELWSGSKVLDGVGSFRCIDTESVMHTATESARIALLQRDASRAPSGTFTVVLHSDAGGTMIHEAVGHGLEADFIEKGISVYSGKLGKIVASPLITVIDDGTMEGKRGTDLFDDEGVQTRKNVLIESGRLVGYLHDRRTAKHVSVEPTGNGRRQSYRHIPIPRMRNTYIAPGKTDPEKIVASVPHGILIKKMDGGQVDIVSGHFVFHISEAYMIENGRIAQPIKGATLTGNGPEVIRSIDMVGNDLGFGIGTCGKDGQHVPVSDAQPTLRIPEIVIGGTEL